MLGVSYKESVEIISLSCADTEGLGHRIIAGFLVPNVSTQRSHGGVTGADNDRVGGKIKPRVHVEGVI